MLARNLQWDVPIIFSDSHSFKEDVIDKLNEKWPKTEGGNGHLHLWKELTVEDFDFLIKTFTSLSSQQPLQYFDFSIGLDKDNNQNKMKSKKLVEFLISIPKTTKLILDRLLQHIPLEQLKNLNVVEYYTDIDEHSHKFVLNVVR